MCKDQHQKGTEAPPLPYPLCICLHSLWLLPSEPTPAVSAHTSPPCRTYSIPPDVPLPLPPDVPLPYVQRTTGRPPPYVQRTTGLLVQSFLLQAAHTCRSIPTPNASPSSALLVVLAFWTPAAATIQSFLRLPPPSPSFSHSMIIMEKKVRNTK